MGPLANLKIVEFAGKEIGADIKVVNRGNGQASAHPKVELLAADPKILVADRTA